MYLVRASWFRLGLVVSSVRFSLCAFISLLKACALQFLHERNISHLDLKPQNILLCGSVLKLAGDLVASLVPRVWDSAEVKRNL